MLTRGFAPAGRGFGLAAPFFGPYSFHSHSIARLALCH